MPGPYLQSLFVQKLLAPHDGALGRGGGAVATGVNSPIGTTRSPLVVVRSGRLLHGFRPSGRNARQDFLNQSPGLRQHVRVTVRGGAEDEFRSAGLNV